MPWIVSLFIWQLRVKMFTYKFSNLLAAPYTSKGASLSFDRKATCLYTPSSNRVCRYQLSGGGNSVGVTSAPSGQNGGEDKSRSATASFDAAAAREAAETTLPEESCRVETFPFEGRVDISHFCVRSDGLLAISVDAHGRGLVVNLVRGVILNRIKFRSNTSSARLKFGAQSDENHVSAAAYSPDDALFAVAIGRTIQVRGGVASPLVSAFTRGSDNSPVRLARMCSAAVSVTVVVLSRRCDELPTATA